MTEYPYEQDEHRRSSEGFIVFLVIGVSVSFNRNGGLLDFSLGLAQRMRYGGESLSRKRYPRPFHPRCNPAVGITAKRIGAACN